MGSAHSIVIWDYRGRHFFVMYASSSIVENCWDIARVLLYLFFSHGMGMVTPMEYHGIPTAFHGVT